MSEEIQIRLSEMREASIRMREAGLNIQSSLSTVQHLVQTLPTPIYSALLVETGYHLAIDTNRWTDQLIDFSRLLEQAAEDIERAAQNTEEALAGMPEFKPLIAADPNKTGDTSLRFGDLLKPIFVAEEVAPATPAILLDGYLNQSNQSLYVTLVEQRNTMTDQQLQLAHLHELRAEKESDLLALENRLQSNGVTDVDSVARVKVMRQEIAQIDLEIGDTEVQIADLDRSIDSLQTRLERIKPGQGADLNLIASLEGSETSPWVQQNTYDCVKHIVNKMPVPGAMATNAFLWDDNAIELAGLGIRGGDEPLVGSVIVFEREHSFADDTYGHLMYVERIENGEVWITDNYNPDEPVRLSEITDELTGPNLKYLYFPWHTKA